MIADLQCGETDIQAMIDHDHSPCLKISFKLDLMAKFTQDLKRFEALQHG